MSLSLRGVWCGSHEAGLTQESVAAYVDRICSAGFNAIFVHLKGGDGRLYWPSTTRPEAIAPGYESFDLPAALLKECRSRGMEMHAWLIDYFEGENGAAYEAHPECAALDANGTPTNTEQLRGSRFTGLWMCPARRPGYTDQWLVPVIAEFAARYEVDSIHHDYVRYPGDLAPDQYCFCDYCLEHLPKWAGYITDSFPEEPFYHELYDRPYLEAHWEQSPRVLPRNWNLLDRASKSRFLLEGGFFHGGRSDLDYFFYTYRTHWITEFTRECAAAVRAVRPNMKISAAVFKNPIHSGRFIGQDWRDFAPYVDICIPMDYRDHYPGSFETYLTLLRETIGSQQKWARDYKQYLVGAAINFLFFEEERPLQSIRCAIERGDKQVASAAFETIEERLRIFAKSTCEDIASWISGEGSLTPIQVEVPHEYWPGEKLERLIDTVAECNPEGIVLFCEGHLHEYGLWESAKVSLAKHS